MKFNVKIEVKLEAESPADVQAMIAQHFTRLANGHHVDSLGSGSIEIKEEAPVDA
jgi:hypothetical protein